jgi:tRNA dimethylallyltransferase
MTPTATDTGYQSPKIIVICGPTASGKTSLAVKLALALKGEIISADSMQVYRGMDVGTAKPTLEERRGIAHYLLDVVDPDENFNAAIYRSMALPRAREIVSRGKACLVAGGTGLYLKVLLGGLFETADSDPRLRQSLGREWAAKGPAELHQRLARLDPEAARRIHPNDKVRVVRALEIMRVNRCRLSELTQEHGFRDNSLETLKIGLQVDRRELYGRINERSRNMFAGGLIEEARGLLDRGYSSFLKPMQAIGYRHALQHIDGLWPLEETITRMQKDTRNYAKRQLTWFRADHAITWLSPRDFERIRVMAERFLAEGS